MKSRDKHAIEVPSEGFLTRFYNTYLSKEMLLCLRKYLYWRTVSITSASVGAYWRER